MRFGLSTLFFALVFAVSTPALAGAPPECETDEECQEMGYELCGIMGCEGGEAMENHTEWESPPDFDVCSSDADCPEGQRCAMNPDAPRGACVDSASSAEDADAASQSAPEGASADEGTDEEVSSGCQGSQTPAGRVLFALGLIGLAMRSRRLCL